MRAHTTYNTGKLCNAPQVSAAPHQLIAVMPACQLQDASPARSTRDSYSSTITSSISISRIEPPAR
eukprot:6394-Heterococcus_DN1.PRE.1